MWLGSFELLGQGEPIQEGVLTSEELLVNGNKAFKNGDFQSALAHYLAFERDYGEEKLTQETVNRNKSLIALCFINLGQGDRALEYVEAALAQETLKRSLREELSFWKAIHLLDSGSYRESQKALGVFFADQKNTYQRRLEALVLFGTVYSIQGYHETAAEFFSVQIPKLRRATGGRDFAGRAVVIQMLSLIQSEQYQRALTLLVNEYPNLSEQTQIISFQTLALQLGAIFIEKRQFHQAIACFQRVWSSEKLLSFQNEKLDDLKHREKLVAANPEAQTLLKQIKGQIKRVEREIENFHRIEDFDAALRLRLAMAFQGLERYREAALIMEDMLQRMEPSPIVEKASLAVIQCWSTLESWPKAQRAAERYLIAFSDLPDNKNLPQVLFMQADAMMRQFNYSDAEQVFLTLANQFTEDRLAHRALFMSGYCQLSQDKNDEAIVTFDKVLEVAGDSAGISEEAFYWKGMALSFSQRYAECYTHMSEYLEQYQGEGIQYEAESHFRRAYCQFCEAQYEDSIESFRAFIDQFGEDAADRDEAYLLLGDALLGVGEADAGIASYLMINPESTKFFEDGWFKVGKAYKLLGDIPKMRAHYLSFVEKYPASKKMPEAVYQIGWTHVQDQNLEAAKKIYLDTIQEHGDKPELFAIEELFLALPKVYKRTGPDGYKDLAIVLGKLYRDAKRDQKNTLQVRTLWVDGKLRDARGDVDGAKTMMIRIADEIDPEIHNPMLVADAADVLLENGELDKAEKLYKDLRKWNPISFHKSRAYKGLGDIALAENNPKSAIDWYKKYEKSAAQSTELANVMLSRIRLEIDSELSGEQSIPELSQILESPAATPQIKAGTLMTLAKVMEKKGDLENAAAYYERVYLAYQKYRDKVSEAYFRRGEILEKMQRHEAAWEVYSELTKQADLADFDITDKARMKLASLASHAPKNTPSEQLQGE